MPGVRGQESGGGSQETARDSDEWQVASGRRGSGLGEDEAAFGLRDGAAQFRQELEEARSLFV